MGGVHVRKKKMGKRQDKGDKCEMEDKTGKEMENTEFGEK